MLSVTDEYHKRYDEETKDLFYQRVLFILLVGIILIPLFSILDFVVSREFFKLFLIYRLGCSGLLLLAYFVYLTKIGREYAYLLAIIAYVVSGFTISMLCVHMGGYDSFYYVGTIMVLVTFTAILPLNALQAGVSGILLYGIYAGPIILLSEP
ncbi:MAG: hypothetical protein JXM72_10845, partial [Deltaproteobacteria bacterium]|nr:hypothetical protein [Deltaproteobacteria bacterium]